MPVVKFTDLQSVYDSQSYKPLKILFEKLDNKIQLINFYKILQYDLSLSLGNSFIKELNKNLFQIKQIDSYRTIFPFDLSFNQKCKIENSICSNYNDTNIIDLYYSLASSYNLIIENCNLNDTVKISSKSAGTGGSRLGLAKNDEISVKHLLYGLMMKSGNDAAVALAEYSSGNIENFAQKMNKKAKELNLTNTNFITPHGLDNENHYTTAYDLAILTDYALNNETFFKIVNSKYYTILINNQPRNISNTNELLGNFDGIYGVKTGFTNGANRCLVTACKRNSLDYICVVLGCDTKKDRTQDSVDLLNYAFKNFSLIDIKQIALKKFEDWIFSHQNSFYINKGKSNKLDLKISIDDLPFSNIAVKNSEKDNIRAEISYSSYFEAPLYENTRIGKLSLSINPQKCYSVAILNKNEILKKSIYDYSIFIFKNYIKLLCKNSPI